MQAKKNIQHNLRFKERVVCLKSSRQIGNIFIHIPFSIMQHDYKTISSNTIQFFGVAEKLQANRFDTGFSLLAVSFSFSVCLTDLAGFAGDGLTGTGFTGVVSFGLLLLFDGPASDF